jgi:Uma2 family endonuclease
MSVQEKELLTPEAYLALEREAPYKSEYFAGEIFAMSGASRRHNLISLNIGAELRAQLRHRPCEVYTSDMRVKVSPTGLYTYPDVVVVCGEPVFEDTAGDTLLNPTVLVEVLSQSTEDYDRGRKLEHYRTIPSLAECLLVSQERAHIVHYVRHSDVSWLLSDTSGLDASIALRAIGCEIALSEIYAKVRFEA